MNNSILTNSTLLEEEPLFLFILSPIILVLQMLNVSVGFPLNIYVTVLLIRGGGLEGSITFTLSQTVSEIIFTLQTPLFMLCQMDRKNLCYVNPLAFFTFFCLSARILFQCSVCFERYLAVIRPHDFRKFKAMKYRLTCALFVWVYSITSGFVCMIYFIHLPYNVFGFLLLLILILHLFFCFSILKVLRAPGLGDGGTNIKKKAFQLVFFSLLAFLIQTIPLTVACSMKHMLSNSNFKLAFNITVDFNIASGILQPFIYLHQMGKWIDVHNKCLPFLTCNGKILNTKY